MTSTERPAEPGERCTCGRQAVTVFMTEDFGETGWCGISDGGAQVGLCPFCGGDRHDGRCPNYQLRPDTPAHQETPVCPESPVSPPTGGGFTTVARLHRDDTPLTLLLLDGLLGRRSDRAELGYQPDKWGAEIDWDHLTNGVLSTTETAVVHIAHGCAIAERHGGPLPPSARGPLRALVRDLAPGDDRPAPRTSRLTRSRAASCQIVEPDDATLPAPGVDL